MTHDDLARSLADHLRASGDVMAWTDMQMGPSGSQRPDVFTIPKTYSRFCPLSYEVKVSIADFRSDVTTGKWQGYLKWSAGVVFACEGNLITKDMVPPTAGLIRRGETGLWRSVKRPTLKPIETLPHAAWMKMVIDGIGRERSLSTMARFNEYRAEQKLRKQLGEDVGRVLHEMRHGRQMEGYYAAQLDEVRRKCRDKEEESRKNLVEMMARHRAEIAPEIVALEQLVGMQINHYGFRDQLRKMVEQLTVDPRILAAIHLVKDATAALDRAQKKLENIPKSLTTLSTPGAIDEL